MLDKMTYFLSNILDKCRANTGHMKKPRAGTSARGLDSC